MSAAVTQEIDHDKADRIARANADLLRVTAGKYEVIGEVGRGGMGSVWLARNPETGKTFAAKMPHTGGEPSEQREHPHHVRFRKDEIPASVILGHHPGVPQHIESSTTTNPPYLITEYIEGRPLDVVLKEGGLSFEQKLDVLDQVSRIVGIAHGNEIAHRDIKPGNIMLCSDGSAVVLDFGLAWAKENREQLTGDFAVGTPRFIAPEILDGSAPRGIKTAMRSDLYALGVFAYELFTGEMHPMHMYGWKSPAEYQRQYMSQLDEGLHEMPPTDDPALQLVAQLCHKDASRRLRAQDVPKRIAQIRTMHRQALREEATVEIKLPLPASPALVDDPQPAVVQSSAHARRGHRPAHRMEESFTDRLRDGGEKLVHGVTKVFGGKRHRTPVRQAPLVTTTPVPDLSAPAPVIPNFAKPPVDALRAFADGIAEAELLNALNQGIDKGPPIRPDLEARRDLAVRAEAVGPATTRDLSEKAGRHRSPDTGDLPF